MRPMACACSVKSNLNLGHLAAVAHDHLEILDRNMPPHQRLASGKVTSHLRPCSPGF